MDITFWRLSYVGRRRLIASAAGFGVNTGKMVWDIPLVHMGLEAFLTTRRELVLREYNVSVESEI